MHTRDKSDETTQLAVTCYNSCAVVFAHAWRQASAAHHIPADTVALNTNSELIHQVLSKHLHGLMTNRESFVQVVPERIGCHRSQRFGGFGQAGIGVHVKQQIAQT